MSDVDEDRFSRQIALFGLEGQRRITESRVSLVGLGGLGSHLAQQLAFLGVRDFVLVDHDLISRSSRNRVVGTRPADVDETTKVDVAKRMILDIDSKAEVQTYATLLEEAQDAFPGRSVVFGGVDSDLARLQLTEIASRCRLPYFDLASDTDADGEGLPTFGGRIVFSDGTRCLHCLDLLDQEEMRRDQLTPEARAAYDKIYGIERGTLGETGPAVVSINATVASLAVTEFMLWVTGVRSPEHQLIYYGEKRVIRRSTDAGKESCPYCRLWRT